jgi:hypothetical protein
LARATEKQKEKLCSIRVFYKQVIPTGFQQTEPYSTVENLMGNDKGWKRETCAT